MQYVCRRLGKRAKKDVLRAYEKAKREQTAGVPLFLPDKKSAIGRLGLRKKTAEAPCKTNCFYSWFFLPAGRREWGAFASVFYPDGETAELTGFYRKEYCTGARFSAFLKTTAAHLKKRGIKTVYVIGDPACEAEKELLKARFKAAEYAEYFLEKGSGTPENIGGRLSFRFFLDGKQIGEARADSLLSGWYLYGIALLPAYRGKGLGKRFLKEMLLRLPGRLFLQVSSKNVPALRLYKSLGFTVAQERDYYNAGKKPGVCGNEDWHE